MFNSSHRGDNSDPDSDRMDDPFENMREQMDRQRDEFFNLNPRDWPSDSSNLRSGFFNKPRTSFGGFPSGSATMRPRYTPQEFPDDDFTMSGHRSLPRNRRENLGGQTQEADGDLSGGSDRSAGSDGAGGGSIPIRVIHEKPVKSRYGQAPSRYTTDLPAKVSSSSTGSESPRMLERAASEPPNKFKQRLNISSANPGGYSTIPENSTEAQLTANSDRLPRSSNHHPSGGQNPIKTSASAPSVPGYQEPSQPVAPPRRSPPRTIGGSGAMSGQQQQQQPATSSSNTSVRHIPIFVEGRPEPLFNPNLNSSQQQQQPPRGQQNDLPFSKPSEFYPPGIQRVKSKEDGVVCQEPTTPLGPPPGPIPMGYTPLEVAGQPQDLLLKPDQVPAEPTTPQGPPPGPIPMGWVPRNDLQVEPQEVQEPPVPPQRHRTPPQPSQQPPEQPPSKAEPARKTSSENESRKDPVVNVIPIKVDHGQPESPPRPQQSSRTPSQEPVQKSPVPAKKPSPPAAPSNPKIAKLEKIKEDVESLTAKIDNFSGSKTDKEYLYLEEMLTRHLLSLDGIEPEGDTEIRQIRKESINSVNRCLSYLDRKVSDITTDAADNDQILSELAEKSLEMSEKKSDNNDNPGSS